jgi:hypothetical protein
MKNQIKLGVVAIVNGECMGENFSEEVKFELIPPKDGNHYGTGYYMVVNIGSHNKQYVDVRYEKTTDIEELADRFIKSYYGGNCTDYKFKD